MQFQSADGSPGPLHPPHEIRYSTSICWIHERPHERLRSVVMNSTRKIMDNLCYLRHRTQPPPIPSPDGDAQVQGSILFSTGHPPSVDRWEEAPRLRFLVIDEWPKLANVRRRTIPTSFLPDRRRSVATPRTCFCLHIKIRGGRRSSLKILLCSER
ncbi:hypothetical protein JAAARDRAFT_317707 [Jaapia argillacea MUCL 33604]|uniref:Uncharacterized protein n=1 Tax=Jaapia argillacea MUCL 33604 TaxID=933084 RepID=A0A067PMJ8_9AGAM|nr:hypothetical protein JAAARDRAFT_317707 [Jaapia argillacea MUCL 33604]